MGNPIILSAKASVISGDVSFHRMKVDLRVSSGGDGEFEMSSPVLNAETARFDVSTALRAVAEGYEYAPDRLIYPRYRLDATVYEEYMVNGELHRSESVSLQEDDFVYGAFSDRERLGLTGRMLPTSFTRKPSADAEIVGVGETYLYFLNERNPVTQLLESTAVEITEPGAHTINGHRVFAVPPSSDRFQFRFLNGLGCIESLSVECLRKAEVAYSGDLYRRAVQTDFGSVGMAYAVKRYMREKWTFSSGMISDPWRAWFIHEFLMARRAWMWLDGVWLSVTIIPKDTIERMDRASNKLFDVQFDVEFDIDGSPRASDAL